MFFLRQIMTRELFALHVTSSWPQVVVIQAQIILDWTQNLFSSFCYFISFYFFKNYYNNSHNDQVLFDSPVLKTLKSVTETGWEIYFYN